MVRNSVKTVAKLRLALPRLTPTRANAEDDPLPTFTCRSFVALVSLIMYARHTTQMNPAYAFVLLRAALAEPATQYLNRVGSSPSAPSGVLSTQYQTGRVSCPRTWFIYTGRPPHISPVAWAAKVPQTRDAHRRWILNLHSMSRSLLGIELHQDALELVRRVRVQQNWKWSTTSQQTVCAHCSSRAAIER